MRHPHEHHDDDPAARALDRRGTDADGRFEPHPFGAGRPDFGPHADRFTHAEPGADYLADVADQADHSALAERVRAAGARAWAVHHGRHVADPQPDPEPVAGEHGDIDALRTAHDDACTRGDRPAIADLARRIAVHPHVHRDR